MTRMAIVVSILMATTLSLFGQEEPNRSKTERPTINDGAFTVDPLKLVPGFLARPLTLELLDSSRRELVAVPEGELKTPVLFEKAPSKPLGEPFCDRLVEGPAYWLLNRLNVLMLSLYVADNVFEFTTTATAKWQRRTNS